MECDQINSRLPATGMSRLSIGNRSRATGESNMMWVNRLTDADMTSLKCNKNLSIDGMDASVESESPSTPSSSPRRRSDALNPHPTGENGSTRIRKTKLDKVLWMNVTDPAQSERASPIVFAPKWSTNLSDSVLNIENVTLLPSKIAIQPLGRMNASTRLARLTYFRRSKPFQVLADLIRRVRHRETHVYIALWTVEIYLFGVWSKERIKNATTHKRVYYIDSQVSIYSHISWRYRYILQVRLGSPFPPPFSPPFNIGYRLVVESAERPLLLR